MQWVKGVAIGMMILGYTHANANRLPAVPFTINLESSYQQTKTFLGKTVGERVSDISFERTGLITDLAVNDGQSVKKGEVVAVLDTQLLDERQKQLRAELRGVDAQLTLSKKELARLKKLRKNGHVSEQDFDKEQSNFTRLNSRRDVIEAQLASNALELNKSVLKAPFDGAVLQRYVNEGVTVLAGQAVLRLQEAKIDEVHIGVAQQFLPILKVGSCYPIVIENQSYQGCIDHLVRQLSARTQTVRIIFSLQQENDVLSGQVAKLQLQKTVTHKGAWVPLDALAQGMRGTWVVYKLISEPHNASLAKIQAHQVEVIYTQGDRAYISGRLATGDQIIASGIHKFAPNQVVEIKPQAQEE